MILRKYLSRISVGLVLVVIVLAALFSLSLKRPALAAIPDSPSGEPRPQVAQAGGLTLEKTAHTEVVALGQPVTYTLTIKNDRGRATDFELIDALPAGLALQERSLSASGGDFEVANNVVSWSGTLADGEEAAIIYAAIPPTTSAADQSIENVASLEAGGTTLEAGATITTEAASLNLWNRFVNSIAWILVATDDLLNDMGLPYAFGFAIIVFTVAVRLATFPLNMQQIKSSKAMQELQPKMKELQEKHKGDREKLAQEQMALYKEHGVNPLGGCLPLLVQMPIWFALYRALIQLSDEGLLNEGFFWIPSLAGPVEDSLAVGFPPEWLYPFVNGAPPLGWVDTVAYLILPVLLVVSQVYMQQMLTPPTTDPQQASMQSIMKFMPLMFGYFALVVPAGLTLYWFTSNILALVQQYFTKTQFQADQDQSKSKKAPVISQPVSDSAPVPASTPSSATSSAARGSRKGKNAKRRKRRKR